MLTGNVARPEFSKFRSFLSFLPFCYFFFIILTDMVLNRVCISRVAKAAYLKNFVLMHSVFMMFL